jgi:hypothetical protein
MNSIARWTIGLLIAALIPIGGALIKQSLNVARLEAIIQVTNRDNQRAHKEMKEALDHLMMLIIDLKTK